MKNIFLWIGISIFLCIIIFVVVRIYTTKNQTVRAQYMDVYVGDIHDNASMAINEPVATQTGLVRLLFGGDMNFDRYIRTIGERNRYTSIFSDDVATLMQTSDCVIANLEGPVTEYASMSAGSIIGSPDNYIFTFDPQIIPVLKNHNFCMVNIGNNHIGNFGNDGIIQTKKYLTQSNLTYIGDTHTENEQRWFVREIGGVQFGFINYNAFVSDARAHVMDDLSVVKDQSDFIVVYTHWGEEYQSIARTQEQIIAHQLVDAGADLIIGSHPHVVQNVEIYKNKTIYYSLGNFVFDQYFSPYTQQGLLVEAIFDTQTKKITCVEHHVSLMSSGITTMKY